MSHVLLKSSTAIPSKDKYHPDLRAHLEAIQAMGKFAEENDGISRSDFGSKGEADPQWLGLLNHVVREYGTSGFREYASGVYSIPFLHPDYIQDLLTEITLMSFAVNPDEEAEVQIPEITLQDTCPSLFNCLYSMFVHVVNPLSKVLYQLEPKFMRSIQFAQYTPEEVSKGHWHHDKDSDITLVVALTDHHKGGGTMVKPQGLGEPFEVPQLPVGHAMLFQGSKTLHQGLPVTEGTRNLLVFWSEIK